MVTLGYKQSNNNHTLFSKYSKKRIYIFLVYVDDIIFLGDDLEQMYPLNGNLLVYFKINQLSKLIYFLQIEVAYSRCEIFLSHLKYTLDLSSKTSASSYWPTTTPIDLDGKLNHREGSPPTNGEDIKDQVAN